MGSLVRCVGCGERCGEKPTGVYWRWMRADGVWKKYYARLCVACYAAKVLPLDVDYPGDTRLTCPSCGIDTEDDYDAVYTTSFPGKAGQLDTESPFCGPCAVPVRAWIIDHARDVEPLEGAPEPLRESAGPPPSATTTLRELGRSTRAK